MIECKIERGVRLPESHTYFTKYPFADMAIGDSFVFPIAVRKRVSAAAYVFQKKHPETKFTSRKIDDEMVRCWRIK